MRMKRCIPKGYIFNGTIFVFGGDDGDTVETFDLALHDS